MKKFLSTYACYLCKVNNLGKYKKDDVPQPMKQTSDNTPVICFSVHDTNIILTCMKRLVLRPRRGTHYRKKIWK